MCGINGVFAYGPAAAPVSAEELRATRDHMATRGPDGAGEWVHASGRVAFGHRRLSIIDLSPAGAQPMVSRDGRFVVTFNGEIYNFRALRRDLERRGRRFASDSDTEVLLHLYAEQGADMVRALRGMFAFAIWDEDRRRLFLARDPYGIKPLYLADDGATIRFASQVKALMAGGALDRAPDPAGLAGFLLWGHVPEPFTTFRSVRPVPAGCTVTVGAEGVRERRYHSIPEVWARAERAAARRAGMSDVRERTRAALLDSVRHHLVADVPVGAFLSAGVDSGALVGLMRDAGQTEIRTVTLAFEEFDGKRLDESPLAAEVARLYGTRHVTRVVSRAEFDADLPRILDAMDQPSIDGINTWFVAKAARDCGLKVAISGLGGDELTGGYPSFRDVPRLVRWLARPARVPGFGTAVRGVGNWLSRTFGASPKAAAIGDLGGTLAGAYLLRRGLYMPSELQALPERDLLVAGLRELDPVGRLTHELRNGPRSPRAVVAALEATAYMRNQLLRDTDWASMAHSLEVRVPLVDHVLLEATAADFLAWPSAGKTILAAAPTVPLPDAVTNRRKTGFSIPISAWTRAGGGGRQAMPHSRRWARQLIGTLASP